MENDVVEEYKSSLSDLNCNSKPMINALTIIAEENIKFATQVVQVIENHINNATPELKLPVLYLIDSIMKNVGREYLGLFSERIVSIFSSVFEKVDEKTRVLLYKLRQTWTEIMPNNKLYAIDCNVSRMDPAWPITSQPPVNKSTKGTNIHINPKFLTASAKKPEDSVAIRELEAKRKAQVLKQLLAKQERIRESIKKEPEKKNNTSSHPVAAVCPPKSSEAVPVERRELQSLDPRTVQRDPRLKKSSVSSGIPKGLDEDKSIRNVSQVVQNQQCPPQKQSALLSMVVIPKASSSQSEEADVSSKNGRKCENSAESSKKKTDKATPLDVKNSSEQTKSDESKSVKRFPSPQKSSSELPHQNEIQDKTQRGQDSSRKTKADASASKNKSSAPKEKLPNSDSKQPSDNKSSAPEKTKSDIKDPHVESVKHSGRPSKVRPSTVGDHPQPSLLEAEKELETVIPRSRSRVTAESKKNSPRHRSRSPLHDEDKKKENKPSRTRSARHLPMQKADGEKVENAQEPAGIKNSATSDFPKVDTDLRVSSRSSASPEKNVKGNKRDTSAFVDVENQENVHEPPVKRVRDEKENENSENVSWFGNQDQDYRCKERENKSNSHQGWAQYKAVHPDEFKSPLRPARENMENIGSGGQNFRDSRDSLLPKHSQSEQRQFGGGPGSFESEYDKLGRPRLYRRRSYDMRFRGRHGRRYDQLPQHENFYYGQNDKDCDVTSMLSNPQYIIRQAEAKFHAGLIDEVCYRDIRGGLQKMMDSARKLGIRIPSFNVSSTYSTNKFLEHGEYPGSRMRQIPVPSAALRAKGPRPPPPITCSFKLDAKMRVVYFVDDKAIVEIDGAPKQIVLKGQPTAVYIEGMDPITVNFDGKPVEFDVDGEMHSLKFGVPKRELYIDDYPYEGEFDGPPFVVDIGDKPHSVRLGGPPPTVVILDKLPHDLYQKFLSVHRAHCSNTTSPIAEKDMVEDSTVPNYPVKTEDTDFRGGEDERTASNTASGSVSSDVDMRTAVKKEPADCERSGNFNDTKYAEIGTNSGVSDMKDVDWRCHPLPPDSAPAVRNDGNYLPPPNADFSSLKDSCRSADSLPDPKLHPSLPRNQIMHSEVEPKFRNTFTESAPQMHQNVWNGPVAHDTSDDRSQNSSDWHDWENSQDRVMTWQECGPRHPQAPMQLHDRSVPRMPDWSRGGRFTPPYAQKEPVDCILPPHGITPQQPNWRQPLETMNEGKPNMPGWDWKQRGYRPDVPPVHPHPSDQGHPYSMQRNDSKPPFESYRGPYEQLPPPPMPPRGPLHFMGNQLRPDMSVPVLRPTIPSSDMRNSRPPMLPQRQWLPRNPIESGLPPSIREQRPLLKFPPPMAPVSGLPSNPPLRTTLPPPPLPPNLPNIPVSLQGTVTFNMPRVPSPVVSEMSHTEPVTCQSYGPSFSGPEVQVKTEVVDTSVSSQGILPTVNTGSQQLTSQIVQPVTSQGNSVTAPSQDTGTSTATDAAPSSSTAPPNVLDLTALMERLIAAGIITTKPSQEKMEVVEPEAKTGNENVDKEEPTPPIEFTTESLKGRYPGVVSALFKGTQCASCGMRFKDTHGERYKRHLDWHFRVNRREKDGAKKAFSRKWYYDVDDWIQFEEFEDFEERARSFFELQADEELLQAPAVIEVPTVPAARGHETEVCVVCGEAFQLLWVEEEEEWHLKDAVREDGQPYHPLCFEDFKKASEVPDTPVDEVPPVETSADKEEDSAEMDATAVPEDSVPKDDAKTESAEAEETKVEENASVKQETAEDTLTASEEETVKVKEEPVEEPLEGKPGEEEIIGVITESDMEEEEKEPPKESKMVVLQSGGIVVKVRAESIQQPASPAPAAPTDKDADQKKEEDSEEEFRPPTPDPRFKVLPPVKKGTELSGLCSIM